MNWAFCFYSSIWNHEKYVLDRVCQYELELVSRNNCFLLILCPFNILSKLKNSKIAKTNYKLAALIAERIVIFLNLNYAKAHYVYRIQIEFLFCIDTVGSFNALQWSADNGPIFSSHVRQNIIKSRSIIVVQLIAPFSAGNVCNNYTNYCYKKPHICAFLSLLLLQCYVFHIDWCNDSLLFDFNLFFLFILVDNFFQSSIDSFMNGNHRTEEKLEQ